MISSQVTSPGKHIKDTASGFVPPGRLPPRGHSPFLTGGAGPEPQSQTDSHSLRPSLGRHPQGGGHLGSSSHPTSPGSGLYVQDAQPQTFRANSHHSHIQSSLCQNRTLSMPFSATEPYIIVRENSTFGVCSKTSLNQSQLLDSSFSPALAQANLSNFESSLHPFPHLFLVIPGRSPP